MASRKALLNELDMERAKHFPAQRIMHIGIISRQLNYWLLLAVADNSTKFRFCQTRSSTGKLRASLKKKHRNQLARLQRRLMNNWKLG